MDLFNQHTDNLLPSDGTVVYYGQVLPQALADTYLDYLLHAIPWKNDEAVIFGKHIVTKRKVAWYGDRDFAYTYSNTTKTALPWTEELVALKHLAESVTGTTYNSCLLNLYHDGSEGMAWHSDDEKMLRSHGSIASMSFGATRNFAFKHKLSGIKREILLHHGSLLEMKDQTQDYWLHRLPPSTKIRRPRINLTFRQMLSEL